MRRRRAQRPDRIVRPEIAALLAAWKLENPWAFDTLGRLTNKRGAHAWAAYLASNLPPRGSK